MKARSLFFLLFFLAGLIVLGFGCSYPPVVPPRSRVYPSGRPLRVVYGKASYYGPGFHGNKTASGELFDQNGLTAAHRSWPFGTLCRVTNRKNGRAVVVRINDRGPFVAGRILDLSYGAAREIGGVGPGTIEVKIEVLKWGKE